MTLNLLQIIINYISHACLKVLHDISLPWYKSCSALVQELARPSETACCPALAQGLRKSPSLSLVLQVVRDAPLAKRESDQVTRVIQAPNALTIIERIARLVGRLVRDLPCSSVVRIPSCNTCTSPCAGARASSILLCNFSSKLRHADLHPSDRDASAVCHKTASTSSGGPTCS